MNFADLGLSEAVLKAVDDAGYTEPTPIQAQAIPQILMGRDVLGCAQTGTGKTASFTLPMIEILSSGRAKALMPRTLILEPTRELAAQVADNFEVYGKYHRLNRALLIGGESLVEQRKVLDRGADVLIATPGRLLDLFERGGLLLNDVKILVIDEADRMLDMGFIPDVEKIVSLLSPIRQTLFFSATMPPAIRRLADAFLMNPKEISVAPPATPAESVRQGLIMVKAAGRHAGAAIAKEKRAALRSLLKGDDVKSALIFCNRKRDVGIVHRSLNRHGFDAGQLHGDMPQPARMEMLGKFKNGEVALMVCSDVAARGIDISDLSHVFNFDVPTHPEDYVHRIGRTGRAGRTGTAFSLASKDDNKYVRQIENLIGKKIDVVDLDNASTTKAEPAPAAPAAPAAPEVPEVQAAPATPAAPAADEKPAAVPSAEAEATPAPTAPEAKKDQEPEKPRQQRRGGRGRDRDRDTADKRQKPQERRGRSNSGDGAGVANSGVDGPIIGMGDHVPAFLMRPVILPSDKPSESESEFESETDDAVPKKAPAKRTRAKKASGGKDNAKPAGRKKAAPRKRTAKAAPPAETDAETTAPATEPSAPVNGEPAVIEPISDEAPVVASETAGAADQATQEATPVVEAEPAKESDGTP